MRLTNILVTGPPRCGKSTLIETVVRSLDRPATGFFTREIREQGRRTGFNIITLGGVTGILAHESIKGRLRVGKYGVNLRDLETIALESMIPHTPDHVVVIDEIGKMECYSALFREALLQALDASNIVIGSIALKGDGFIQRIKTRPDVRLFLVTEENRTSLARTLSDLLSQG